MCKVFIEFTFRYIPLNFSVHLLNTFKIPSKVILNLILAKY